ncbi:MAG: hypothetical protein B7Y65_03535 [Azorhizobium sp. 35-67-15]|nr:MAG: hypothetical protein B7Y65_03535 [Azorhizobium sp. 35-67-15]
MLKKIVYERGARGRENASSGTEGSFDLYDGEMNIGNYYWDCPWGRKTNTSTWTPGFRACLGNRRLRAVEGFLAIRQEKTPARCRASGQVRKDPADRPVRLFQTGSQMPTLASRPAPISTAARSAPSRSRSPIWVDLVANISGAETRGPDRNRGRRSTDPCPSEPAALRCGRQCTRIGCSLAWVACRRDGLKPLSRT